MHRTKTQNQPASSQRALWRRNLVRAAAAALTAACAASAFAADILAPGVTKREYYAGGTIASIKAGTAGTPSVSFLNALKTTSGGTDNYADRFSGLFIPDVTGSYVFYVAADDAAEFWISTDATEANKRLVARETAYSNEDQWNASAGNSDLLLKRSDTFSPDAGVTYPFANGIDLVAGQRYFFEAFHQDGTGGDHFSVTFKRTDEVDPLDGDDTRIRGALTGVMTPQPTTLTFTTNPQTQTTFQGMPVRLSIATQTDSQVTPTYQWRRNGQNITGATGANYNFIGSTADSGATFDVVASVPGLSSTSAVGTVTIQATGGVTVPNALRREFYPGALRAQVLNGVTAPPASVTVLSSFEAPSNAADNYAQRVSGLFTPAVSGNYVFFVAADDDTDLFLSTDASPANKRLIAQEPGWSGVRNWLAAGDINAPDAVNTPQKRSDQWSPDQGVTTPFAAGIPLTAGQPYYIEAVHHEGGSGDNLAVTFKLINEADPDNGTATRLTGNLISFVTKPTTSLTLTSQPVSTTTTQGKEVTFSVAAQTDSELSPAYQWRRNGVNISGATSSSYKTTVAAADNNAVYDVVVTVPGTTQTVTSSPATLTVQSGILSTGLRREFYPLGTRASVAAGTAGAPTVTDIVATIDSTGGRGNDYAHRFSGFFIPSTTGRYVFFIAADDDTDVYLGTDENPSSKRLIMQEGAWSGYRNWNTPGDAAQLASQKRSDQWSPDGGATMPHSAGIQLTAGQRYFFEVIQHQGSGGDNISITYKLFDEADPLDGDASRITSSNLGFYAAPATVAITQQPASQTVLQNRSVTFTAAATTTSEFPTIFYQWQKNGVDIAGATGASYTLPQALAADNNAQFTVKISAAGAAPITSQAAVLTVTSDSTAPTVVSAGALTGASTVGVLFNELVEEASAETVANYQVSGGAQVTAAKLHRGNIVELTLGGAVGATFTVTVNGVKDLAGNTLTAGTVNGQITDLQNVDIGFPQMAGQAFSWGQGVYVAGGGTDIWGNADQFHFAYRQASGAFDVRVRADALVDLVPQDAWAKTGIMVRESLEGGSRNEMILATRNEGNGQNQYNHQWRNDTDGASESMADAARRRPVVYPSWMRIVRPDASANTFVSYLSDDGQSWTPYFTNTLSGVALPSNLFVGLGTTSHGDAVVDANGNPEALAEGYFSNFTVQPYVAVVDPLLTIGTTANGQVTISWQSGTLLSSPNAAGPYQPVAGATSPMTIAPTGTSMFYRVRQ